MNWFTFVCELNFRTVNCMECFIVVETGLISEKKLQLLLLKGFSLKQKAKGKNAANGLL